MRALKIARWMLVGFAVVWGGTLLMGKLEVGNPLTLYVIAIYAAIGLGGSAVACVIIPLFVRFRRRNSN